jgi:hypothetical protein
MSDFNTLKNMAGFYIDSEDIQNLVESFLTEKVPEYFQKIPASSSGKYHPSYTLGEGGLLRHTIAAVKILRHTLNLDFMKNTFSDIERDKMTAAMILHDTFKYGVKYDLSDYKDHEMKAAEQVKEYFGEHGEDIARLIACHMGQWGIQQPQKLDEFIVHQADYLASRKNITVDVM